MQQNFVHYKRFNFLHPPPQKKNKTKTKNNNEKKKEILK